MLGPLSRIAPAPLLLVAFAVGACSSPPTAPTNAGAPALTNLSPSQLELRGTTLDSLRNANWDCQERFPGIIACAPPGIGLPPIPSLGENGRPVYEVAVFLVDGTPTGTAHFLRADLYHGQTCAFTGQLFVFRPLIGYYECFRAA